MIDAVYTWVDGEDQQWLTQKCAAMRRLAGGHHESAIADSRFKCRDELRSLLLVWLPKSLGA